ncbi:MAG: arginine--tRNA ligase [Planctomycetes bacterium]|nr:arginine--tRNA ligase [Planctomycetota bacterium]
MESTLRKIAQRFEAALVSAFGEPGAAADPMVRPVQDARFGDYQSNCAMALAKRVQAKPRELADRIVAALDIDDLCDPPEIAGPGFINLRLRPEYVAEQLRAIPPGGPDDRLGLALPSQRQTVAVDFSSPNLAKEMHVGHLRSTVIGECVSRILEFDGHTVHRINHVGDWGTQFGMLVAFLRETQPEVLDDPEHLHLGDLEAFYVQAKRRFDTDAAFADRARRTVVDLQGGDEATRTIWKAFCEESLRHCQVVYDRLGVKLENRGESFYNDMLAGVVADLEERGMVTISDGAACVFLEGFEDKSRDGAPLPIIVRKSDGAYNYSTTDLAAIRHRRFTLGVTRFIYVVGAPQRQHFQMLFAAARRAGWVDDRVELTHLAFGSMLGADGRPFKTRDGGTIKLKNLLDEAVARARKVIEANEADERKRRGLTADQQDAIAEAVGITAVRYFDLSHNLTSDYTFDWDRILAMDGNTGPYMLYAYARIRSIGREAGIDYADLPPDAPIILEHPAEIGLAKTLLRLPEIIETISRDLRPNVLTDYLFELSRAYNLFYDRKHGVRVKDAKPEAVRTSRLRLCDLTARALRLGLGLLGISTIERM